MYVSSIYLRNFKSFPSATLKLDAGFNAVVGPNGSGKCLKGSSEVLLADGKLTSIRQLVESALADSTAVETMDDGVFTLSNPTGIEVFSLNPETLKVEKRRVQAFVKRTSPETLVEVTTRSGRKVTTTAYHPLITIRDGKVTAMKAEEIRPGEFIATPRLLEVNECRVNPAVELASQMTCLYLGDGKQELLEKTTTKKLAEGKTWKQVSAEAGILANEIDGLRDGQSIRLHSAYRLAKWLGLCELEIARIIHNAKAKNGRKQTRLPTELSPNLAKIIGYTLAEGRVVRNEVFFFNENPALNDDFCKLCEIEFNIKPIVRVYAGKHVAILPSSAVTTMLECVFGIKPYTHSRSKNIPAQFLSCRSEALNALLSAMYDGDGSVSQPSQSKVYVEYATASHAMASRLVLLLLKRGIVARVSEGEKYASNTAAKTRRTYYRVSVYGLDNAEQMAQALSYSLEKLPKLLEVLKAKAGNTRATAVDLVPGINSFVKESLQTAGYSDRKLKKVKPSRIRAYYEDRCLPTRDGLMQVAKLVSGADALEIIKLAESSVFWDAIAGVKTVNGEEWVYDLCVEGNHNFLAEGMFVHNSNVIDGLLFAFGESSLKSMRVKKTSDLVLGGGKVAEVTVTFEGSGGRHTVTRLVKRDGKTKYVLDGKRTKKYALEEFLAHNGVTLTNVIKQGEVQRVVEVNTKERRMLIDIAANVAEYESKKKEAMSELDGVEAKLREAATVLGEREGYLNELARERENALKLKALRGELESLKATLIYLDITVKEKEFEAAINAHLDGENKLGAIAAQIKEKEAEIARINAEKDEINRQVLARSQGAAEGIQREIDAITHAVEDAKKTIEEKKAELQELYRKQGERKLEKQRADDEVKGCAGQKANVEKELAATRNILAGKKEAYDKLLNASNSFSQQFHDARTYLEKAGDEMLKCKERLTELQAEVSSSDEIARLKERELERLKFGEFEDYAPKAAQLEEERRKATVEAKNASGELDALFSRERGLNERVPVLEDLILLAREKSVEISSRLRVVSDAPASRSLEAIMALKEKFPGIHGTVEDLVSYPGKFAVPVQVALGSRANFVVVDGVKTAGKAIEMLKERKLGRVSFIPLDKIHAPHVTSEDRSLAEKHASLGFVIDHISFDAQYRKAMEYACGNTIVMPSLKAGDEIVGKIRFSTMDGELVEGSGIVTGGSFQAKVNAAAERRQQAEWEAKLEEARGGKEKVLQELQELRDEMAACRKRKADADVALKTVEIQLQHLTAQQTREAEKQEDASGAAKQLRQEVKQLREKIAAGDGQRRELIRQLSELNLRMLDAKQKIDLEKEAAFGTQLKERERNISDLKVQMAEHENSLKAINSRLEVYQKQASSLGKELGEAAAREGQCDAAVKEADRTVKEGNVQLKLKLEEQKKLSSAFADLLNRREKLEGMVQKLGNDKGKLEFERDRNQRLLNESNLRRGIVEATLVQLKAQFDEFKNAKMLEGNEKPELLARLKIVQVDINELGDVNLRAIELYDQRAREFEEQKVKVQQMANEKQAIIALINEIESKKVATFMETFNTINNNFKAIFSKIFKGDGHLFLENAERPFEGGLTIEVKLDNKEIKYLELMSGGEKALIALIFIFALQSVNPSSIYILDEPDAALDAENSRKLSELVQALAKGTQFIVISHNQNVYKTANMLVGVAMAKGESKIVEVKLNE